MVRRLHVPCAKGRQLRFRDRLEAAELLAQRLVQYRGQKPLILAIPRGGVPMGEHIAKALQGELDVVLVHKLRAPHQPEFAIGAVSEAKHVYITEDLHRLGISREYLEKETQAELKRLKRRRALYTPVRAPISPAGRITIVVDDGVATGWTMLAALRLIKDLGPKKLIAAIAVAPPDAIARLEKEADEMVCLISPREFLAVGQFFEVFEQVTEEQAIECLRPSPEEKR